MSKYIDSSGLTYLWSKIKAYIQSLNYTSNIGTVTGITMNNTSYSPINGDIDIGTVVTDVSDKADDADVVHIEGAENITGVKTFVGNKTVKFKQSSNSDKIGFTCYNKSDVEFGNFEVLPQDRAINLGIYNITSTPANDFLVGFKVQAKDSTGVLHKFGLRAPSRLGDSTYAEHYIPVIINNKEADNTGSITLSASDVGALSSSTIIPDAQIQSDWNQTTTTALDYIKNKPIIPAAQIQADWNQTTTTSLDYIKNKPDITQVNSPVKTITISGVSNSIVIGDDVSIGRNNSKIEIGSSGGDNETIKLTTTGSDGGVYVSTDIQKFYYNNKEVATKDDIPTVYAWAQATTKPSYTAADVGAVPITRTVNGKALNADITLSASDVNALPSSTIIPSAPGTLNTTATTAQSTSSSEALSGNVTLHKVAKTGTYSDLIGTPTIPTISTDVISDGIDDTKTVSPKAVKIFVEGKGYLTSETEPDFNGSAAASITSANIIAWNGKQDALVFNTAYNASSNKVATTSDIPDVSGKEDTSNKVTSLSSSSTDTQYPSAKCVYDLVGDIETILISI